MVHQVLQRFLEFFAAAPEVVVQLIVRFVALLDLEHAEAQAELAAALDLGVRALALADATAAAHLAADVINLASGARHRRRARARALRASLARRPALRPR